MNCDTCDTTLGDYVDGTIDPAAANTVAAHLAICERCRSRADDLAAIRSAAGMLEHHVPPARTWHRIAAAVDEERTGAFAWLRWQPLAAAAVLMIALGTWWMVRPATPPAVIETNAAGGAPGAQANIEVENSEDHYQSAIAGLEQITNAAGDELDPQTAAVLKTNLTVIDTAIGESRAALETEPASDVAQERLFAALNTKLALLQDTVSLINEMRQGDQDAAGITTGLNQ